MSIEWKSMRQTYRSRGREWMYICDLGQRWCYGPKSALKTAVSTVRLNGGVFTYLRAKEKYSKCNCTLEWGWYYGLGFALEMFSRSQLNKRACHKPNSPVAYIQDENETLDKASKGGRIRPGKMRGRSCEDKEGRNELLGQYIYTPRGLHARSPG